ncbi:MAG TPA: molybdopterin cofactor-binding domain-containing protein, partial [Candidatus Acidoferrales bacterium]|nr:molybdopterin cofactor-binding domain-containing protein [Candidatus Acidoferrales bacterium]
MRSLYAHARVLDVNVERARGAPGVAAALSGREVASWIMPFAPRFEGERFWPTVWAPLAPERVRFVGEPVAVLCAESAPQAFDACELVDVGYDPLPALSTIDSAVAPDAPLLHDDVPGNVLFHCHHTHGDVDGAFARAHLVLRETFSHGRCSASPLEGRGVMAAWDGDRLT